MKKEEFEIKLITLIEEFTECKIRPIALQRLLIEIKTKQLPRIETEGFYPPKESP